MSNNLRTYVGIDVEKGTFGNPSYSMDVTAYVGGPHGRCIQLTMNDKYICLAENQVKDLIDVLMKRLWGYDGYSATDSCPDEKTVEPEEVKQP